MHLPDKWCSCGFGLPSSSSGITYLSQGEAFNALVAPYSPMTLPEFTTRRFVIPRPLL